MKWPPDNGLWPRDAIDWVLNPDESHRARFGFLVNYNNDIPKPQRYRLDWFCANLLLQLPSTTGIKIHCVDRRHLETIDRCAGFTVNSVGFGISQPISG